ncbi:centrin-1 [Caerostris darwini]|uniref:Centrin-1 n=2 Tax=Caerostris TaxID=172845 RepID=A0AAV4PFZ0_9ARAC|nr:centrin-1 [Caerostris darwini]
MSSSRKSSVSTSKKRTSLKIELSDEQKKDIKDAFNLFDSEETGFIPTRDLKVALRALGFEPKKEEIKKMVSEIDKDSTGKIAYDDFYKLMSEKINDKGANQEIMKAFQLFDNDNTGKISFENLKRVAEELGETISDEELKEMIMEADRDGDGQVNQEEFLRIMKKTCLY